MKVSGIFILTPKEDFHAEGVRVEDEDNVGPRIERKYVFGILRTTFL